MIAGRLICASFIALSLLIVGLWVFVFRHSGLVYGTEPDWVMWVLAFCSLIWFLSIQLLACILLNPDWRPHPAWLVASAFAGWPACWIGWFGFVYHIAPAC